MLDSLPAERVLPALRFLIQESKSTREALAKDLGYSTSAIGRRLSGETDMSVNEAAAMATALGYELTVSLHQISDQGARRSGGAE